MIVFETNLGNFSVDLDQDKAPKTCENFLNYVEQGFYDNTIFHRVINGFVVQGGGFDEQMQQKDTKKPIENEAETSSLNKRGTLAMARTGDPHSATSQFFINLEDNDFLNFSAKDPQGWGYCVFGRVVDGMDVIDKMAQVSTTARSGHQNVPENNIVVNKVTFVKHP